MERMVRMPDAVDRIRFAHEVNPLGNKRKYELNNVSKKLSNIFGALQKEGQPEPASQEAGAGTLQMHQRAPLCLWDTNIIIKF